MTNGSRGTATTLGRRLGARLRRLYGFSPIHYPARHEIGFGWRSALIAPDAWMVLCHSLVSEWAGPVGLAPRLPSSFRAKTLYQVAPPTPCRSGVRERHARVALAQDSFPRRASSRSVVALGPSRPAL